MDDQYIAFDNCWRLWPKRVLFDCGWSPHYRFIFPIPRTDLRFMMPNCPTIRPAIPRTQCVVRRPAEGSRISPSLRPAHRTDNLQWYRAISNYDAWETDGVRREFGYLAINSSDICFSNHLDERAHQASRYGLYRYVVSYRGTGWVPSCVLQAL